MSVDAADRAVVVVATVLARGRSAPSSSSSVQAVAVAGAELDAAERAPDPGLVFVVVAEERVLRERRDVAEAGVGAVLDARRSRAA